MHVTEESHADWVWKPGSAGAPRDTLGWKPVQLVPEQARAGRGGFPLGIRPHERQAFVVEIYTGRDRPAGTYSGSIAVADGGRQVSLPVTLELLDFALPDSPSLPVMVYYESSQPRLYQGRDLDEAYDRFAHRHRIELVHAYDEQSVQRQMARFDGSRIYTRAGV